MKKLLIIALLVVGCDYAPTEHSHTEYIHGCLDSQATNYDSTAVIDNNSCEFKHGCLDSLAMNYDSTAVLNNNSCEYEVVPATCITEIIGCDEPEDFWLPYWGSSNRTYIECEITIINTGQDTLSSFTSIIHLKNYNDEGLLNIKSYYNQNNVFSNTFLVPNDTLNKEISFDIDNKFLRCIDGGDIWDDCAKEFDDLVEFTISHTVICLDTNPSEY